MAKFWQKFWMAIVIYPIVAKNDVFKPGRCDRHHCQYWLILDPGSRILDVFDFAIRAFLNIQHQVSSIQHLPRKGNRLMHTCNAN